MAINPKTWANGDHISVVEMQNLQDNSVNESDNIHTQYVGPKMSDFFRTFLVRDSGGGITLNVATFNSNTLTETFTRFSWLIGDETNVTMEFTVQTTSTSTAVNWVQPIFMKIDTGATVKLTKRASSSGGVELDVSITVTYSTDLSALSLSKGDSIGAFFELKLEDGNTREARVRRLIITRNF